jgi:FtsH-binding integral membrane protein
LFRKKLKKNKKKYELSKYIAGVNIIIGLGLVFSGLVSLESIAPYGQRWLSVFEVSVWVIFMLIAIWRWTGLKREAKFDKVVINERKQNWLKKAGKKK